MVNKANLRDLIAATGLVILLKFDPNHRFFVTCDLEIWWMALENNRAPLLYSRVTLYTAGHLHTAVPHCSHSRAPIVHTAVPRENNEHSCVYLHCRAVCKLPGCVEGHPWYYIKLCASFQIQRWIQIGNYSPETLNLGQNRQFFVPCDLEIWQKQ